MEYAACECSTGEQTVDQSRRHGRVLVGLDPPNKAPTPPNWNMKDYKSAKFLSNLNVKPPRTKLKPPIDDFLATALPLTMVSWLLYCPIHRTPHGLHGLTVLDDETIEWLLNTCYRCLHRLELLRQIQDVHSGPVANRKANSNNRLIEFTLLTLGKDEHWTRLRLDWIRTITNFRGFGLDPDCK